MATYYFRNSGVNWGDAANWSLSDGGPADGAVPTSADDAIFTNNSGNCTVNASARVCKTLNFSTYTNTLTRSNGITVSGNVTLGASMGLAGSSGLIVNETATITSNGIAWNNTLTLSGSVKTHTITGAFTCSDLTVNNVSGVLNGSDISVTGNMTSTSINGFAGNGRIVMTGTGNVVANINNMIGCNFRINTTGTITFNGDVYLGPSSGTSTFDYIAGDVNHLSGTLYLNPGGAGFFIIDTILFTLPAISLSSLLVKVSTALVKPSTIN